jgi:hypothetical protein
LAIIYAGPKLKDSGADSINYKRNKSASSDIDEGPDKPAPAKPEQKPKPPRRR